MDAIDFLLCSFALDVMLVMSVSSEETNSYLIGLQIILVSGVYFYKQIFRGDKK